MPPLTASQPTSCPARHTSARGHLYVCDDRRPSHLQEDADSPSRHLWIRMPVLPPAHPEVLRNLLTMVYVNESDRILGCNVGDCLNDLTLQFTGTPDQEDWDALLTHVQTHHTDRLYAFPELPVASAHVHGEWDAGGYCNRLVLDDNGDATVCGWRSDSRRVAENLRRQQ